MKNTITIFRAAVILNLVFLVLFMTVSGAAAQPLEVWVDDDYCNSCPNDGRTWNYDAFGNIQDGIDAVETAGTVHVAAGVYEGKLYLKPGVFLSGAGIEVSIIDGVGIREGEGDNDALVQLASNSKISGFSIINGGWQGLRCNGVSAIIEGNLIAHHEREGIVLAGYGAGHSIIKNNIVTDCFGIGGNSVYYSPQIINNTIVNNRANGIYFWYAGTPVIKNNIIVHNRQNGIAIGGIPGNFAQAITSHNNVWENGVNYFNCDPGVGSISMNPSFSNESIGNYRLNATSPCIDAGTNESPGTTLTDLDGNPRIYNGVVDMGAFEFVSWPITLQAEDYIAYYDKTPGNAGGHYRNDDVDIWWYHPDHFYVGSAGTNEWLEYAINLPADGEYRLDIRVATPNNGRRVHVEFDGVDKTGSLTVPNTGGWTTWQTLSTRVELTAGRQVMRLVIDYGGLNIDWVSAGFVAGSAQVAAPTIEPDGGTFINSVDVTLATETAGATIYYTTDGSDPVTSGTRMAYVTPLRLTEDTTVRAYGMKAGLVDSAEVIVDFIIKLQEAFSLVIEAEDYDPGGQRKGYYDKTPGNAGGHYRNDDVDIWRYHPDIYYIGSNSTGEWLNYTIDVPADGEYRLDIRVATPNNGRRVHVEFDGVDKTGSLTVPNTGGWTTWQTLSTRVELTAGRQVMRLAIDYGGLNIDWISLADTDNRIWYGDYTVYSNDDLVLLSGYTSVTGELRIRGDSSITNLASLIDLTSVGGNLSIVGIYYNNSNLSNLEGLNNLVTVKGELILTGNPNIVNLEGLSRLTSVGGMLIGLPDDDDAGYENESLTSLKGLESLSRVKGNIRICGNPGLESLDGLNNLEIIDGSLKFENYNYKNTYTVDNSAMSSVTALRSLVFIGGDLLLGGMENLSSLEGLNNLAFIGGTLSICENINLLELSMTNLGQVNGDFVICRNSRLPPSLAEELMNQVLNRGGIGGKIDLVCRYFVFW